MSYFSWGRAEILSFYVKSYKETKQKLFQLKTFFCLDNGDIN